MGLAICRRIVDAQGGRIWAEHTDRGARFCFTLPLAAAAHADD
jgi:signal transduction histidine kinase